MMRINNQIKLNYIQREMLMLGTNLSRIHSTLTTLLYSANVIVRCCWLPASRKPPKKGKNDLIKTIILTCSCPCPRCSSSCIISSSKRLYRRGNGENGNPDGRYSILLLYSPRSRTSCVCNRQAKTAAPSTLYTHLATT